MPTDYLVHVLVLGLAAAAALAPPRHPRPVARAAYLLGVVVNEVPHLALLALAVSTAVALGSGDLGNDLLSRTLLVAAAVTAAVLAFLTWRAARAHGAARAALRAARIGGAAAGPGRWRVALTPLPFRPRQVERLRNFRYGDHRRQRLDVLRRRDRPAGGPVLVYFHGGGYFTGSKNWEARALLHHFAARGWVCVSATYRLRPGADFADHVADARAAVAWSRAHAAEHGGDPATVVMAGSSAGAHLTSLYALSSTPRELPAAAVCLYGYYGRYYGRGADEEVPSTPFALDAARAPAFVIAHGELDSYTPPADARRLAAKLRAESSAPVVHLQLPGGQHGFDLVRSWRLAAVIQALDALLAEIAVPHGPPGPASGLRRCGRRGPGPGPSPGTRRGPRRR